MITRSITFYGKQLWKKTKKTKTKLIHLMKWMYIVCYRSGYEEEVIDGKSSDKWMSAQTWVWCLVPANVWNAKKDYKKEKNQFLIFSLSREMFRSKVNVTIKVKVHNKCLYLAS